MKPDLVISDDVLSKLNNCISRTIKDKKESSIDFEKERSTKSIKSRNSKW